MLKRTDDALQANQETSFRRLIRTFDPEVPGYFFWPIIFGVAVIFQQADQIARQFGKPTDFALSPPILDSDILALMITRSG